MKKLILTLMILFMPCIGWGGVDFDGTDDFLDCTDFRPATTAITVIAWINIQTNAVTAGHASGFVAKGHSGSQPFVSIDLTELDTSGLDSRFGLGISGTLQWSSTADTFGATGWNLWIGRWTSGNQISLDIYDTIGANVFSNTAGANRSGSITYSTESFNIGKARDGGTNYPDAIISEVAVWDIELTDAELSSIINGHGKRLALQIKPSNLQAYWALDEVSDGVSGDGVVFKNLVTPGTADCTGDNGAGNDNLTGSEEKVLTYP